MLQTARDVAIILMAVGSFAVAIGLLVLIFQVWKLVGLARKKFDVITDSATDILDKAKDTAQTASQTAKTAAGTAEFVADRAALPVIEAYSVFAGASKFAEAIVRKRKASPTEPGAGALSSFVGGLLIGAVAGAAVGLLLAPASGEANRERLLRWLGERDDRIPSLIESVTADVNARLAEGRAAFLEATATTRTRLKAELDVAQHHSETQADTQAPTPG